MTRRPPRVPTAAAVAQAIDLPIERWTGNCFAVASKAVDAKLVAGTAVYGHWRGPIDPDSHFADRRHVGFVQHGWIVGTGAFAGLIVDPTRWVFEATLPYVWVGPADAREYDEGGNVERALRRGPPPAMDDSATLLLRLPKDAATAVLAQGVGTRARGGVVLTRHQLVWLVSGPFDALAPYTARVYRATVIAGMGALIPIDNRRRAERAA